MSKIFYDKYINMDEIERYIKKVARTSEEKEELYQLVDELVHHKVVGCILDKLPRDNHDEFLTKFSEKPHDESLIDYLREKFVDDIEEFIKQEIHDLTVELLGVLEVKTRPTSKQPHS